MERIRPVRTVKGQPGPYRTHLLRAIGGDRSVRLVPGVAVEATPVEVGRERVDLEDLPAVVITAHEDEAFAREAIAAGAAVTPRRSAAPVCR